MEVQVFTEEEKRELIGVPEEWLTQVKELGLEGQAEIMQTSKSPCPFSRIDAGQLNVLLAVFPSSDEISKFDREPIPMKALGAYGLAKKEGYFKSVTVRYMPGQLDPVMLGTADNGEIFLMAAWGPEKFDWAKLKAKAIEMLRPKYVLSIKEDIIELENNLKNAELNIEKHLNGEWVRGF